ncbi:MAG: 16S rRNA (cytosine(1402)-N(4))-methyltransferase RsmH [Dehalococcoidia bacterium]|nr:16S rRNA (cytosine(1402)-N(4))-methyltransferase RsmH [Dehalococcoidia bacterium]
MSALPAEVMDMLAVGPGSRCVDATLGDGGHAAAILEATAPDGKLLGIDADPQALERARKRLSAFGDRAILVNDNFANMEAIVERHSFRPVLAVLMDLGLSSWQLESGGRGFSFREDVGLDMRLSPSQPVTASDVVNTYSQVELQRIISTYGEEHQARRIAAAIVRQRPIGTALQLAQAIEAAVPRRGQRIHPATRTFQAIRVFVNRELETLESALEQAVRVLEQGGRLVVIAYHSLDDRLIKTFLRRESRDCICPTGQPTCTCEHRASVRLLTKKVVKPSAAEVRENPRVRSARLRACVALGQAQ